MLLSSLLESDTKEAAEAAAPITEPDGPTD